MKSLSLLASLLDDTEQRDAFGRLLFSIPNVHRYHQRAGVTLPAGFQAHPDNLEGVMQLVADARKGHRTEEALYWSLVAVLCQFGMEAVSC